MATFDSPWQDDLLALFQKQYPFQISTQLSLPALTPPSDDSSPSPPTISDSTPTTNHHPAHLSAYQPIESTEDTALKRKASDDSLSDDGPIPKNPHIESNEGYGNQNTGGTPAAGSGNRKASANSRRKGSESSGPDQSKLMKRKEQNRAAQRAFRERKEKHVKDLEDKVAALEAKNDQAVSENENLRDLLARLQSENMRLKQRSFSFSVPKNAAAAAAAAAAYGVDQQPSNNPQQQLVTPPPSFGTPSPNLADPLRLFEPTTSGPSTTTSSPPLPGAGQQPSVFTNDTFDWNSLMAFDPAILNLLDDTTSQPTATDPALHVPFDFTGDSSYTTIASNPAFTSFADAFDTTSPFNVGINDDATSFDYDLQSWSTTRPLAPPTTASKEPGSLDDFFGNPNFLGAAQNGLDYNGLSIASMSPVRHASSSSSSSLSFTSNPSLFSLPRTTPSLLPIQVGGEDLTASINQSEHDSSTCPKTREQVKEKISSMGSSPFVAPVPQSVLQLHQLKEMDEKTRSVITCQGTKGLPKTPASDRNVEVLAAWKTITATPAFKDGGIDISELCAEFSSKARCDGTKVVLEPGSVANIIGNLEKRKQQR